jgi:hypothetical protein
VAANAQAENRLMSRMTLITSFGDFVSIFATMKVIEELGFPPTTQAFIIVVNALALGVGGWALPMGIRRWDTRLVLVWAQFLSFAVSTFFAIGYFQNWLNLPLIYSMIFLLAILKQLFDGARETQSKGVAASTEQRSFVASLLGGHYLAQVCAPLIAFVLLRYFSPGVPLILDAVTFAVTSLMALRIHPIAKVQTKINVFRPLTYMWKLPLLRDLFFLRAVIMWISNGLFNYVMIAFIADHYHLDTVSSVFTYVTIGLGAFTASFLINRPQGKKFAERWGDPFCSATGQITMAAVVFTFGYLKLFWVGAALFVIHGFAMGTVAITSQHLRRTYTTSEQLPEIIGLEIMVGRLVNFTVGYTAKVLLEKLGMNMQWIVFFDAFVMLVAGLSFLRFPKRIEPIRG